MAKVIHKYEQNKGVAICCNLSHDGTTKENKRGIFLKRKRVGVATEVYLS